MAVEEDDLGHRRSNWLNGTSPGFEEDRRLDWSFSRMFSGETGFQQCLPVDIQAGAGGTEAQDWADMILRMYLRWAEAHGFKADVIEASAGEVAGIKSSTRPHCW